MGAAGPIDLTYSFDEQSVYWPTETGFHHWYEHHGRFGGAGHFYAAGKFYAPEHGGTHMDAPLHFAERGASADQVFLGCCIGPACVVDFEERAERDPDAMLAVSDIERHEREYGPLPAGAILVARSGWGKFWPDKKRYLGTDRWRDVEHLRFPGYSPEAVSFLLRERSVAALAIDTASLDPGNATDFPVHRLWLGAGRPGFENLANVGAIPPRGAVLYCIPMKIAGGTGAPARVFALVP
ncbi:Kynurenine formamidase [Methylacidimicrobium cyclopophantes]|uniref:Kynurenine formamidase n=1 Tax=Methylacidimicrobium cyclopophantes TaxID=1041766 RepID=A0A5E6MER7_9BACT|nr:cyclase family protein [Methylacidimicrobium cyclopophantes]VVM07725.1 Kynurenine formamidase [Methylacidimicrobium cyclopophantes]